MKLVGAALVLLAISGCSAEVVQDFIVSCNESFADPKEIRISPTRFTGFQYKQICQTLNNKVEYATYYDTTKKIPVYSAYKFWGVGNCSRRNSWFIEPQLDQHNGDINMASEGKVPSTLRGKNQSLNRDYTNSGYHRGHLAPVYHTKTQSCSDATFTLTNAAPQSSSFNEGQWRVTEKNVSDILSTDCLNVGLSAYVVTGVVPGNKKIKNKTVNVPSYFWTAYCCLDNNKKPQISGGYYGANVNNPVNSVSVRQLESFLTGVYGKGPFQLFGNGGCVKRRCRTKPCNSDRSRKRFRTAEDFAEYLVSSKVKPRSDYERVCLMLYASSRQRSPIMKPCAGNRFSSFKPESKIDEFCATVFRFASSRQRSSDEEDSAIFRTEKDDDY